MTDDEYENSIKELAWTTCWLGYRWGRDVESFDSIDKKTARANFERWWDRNK